jgi:hypothetical protein
MTYNQNGVNYGYDSDSDDDRTFMSNSTAGRKKRKILSDLNKEDKYCFSLQRKNPYTGKNVRIRVFGSGDTGTSIRDAITGIRNFNHKVGSCYEDLYFKVGISTGEVGRNSPSFFYDSPEQYERQHFTQLPESIKKEWRYKNLQAKRDLNVSDESVELLENGQRATIVK